MNTSPTHIDAHLPADWLQYPASVRAAALQLWNRGRCRKPGMDEDEHVARCLEAARQLAMR